MVVAFVKSNWLDNMQPVDDNNFKLDLFFQWVGTLHGVAISVDQDQLLGTVFPYTELSSAAAFAAHLKSIITARAAELGYTGLSAIEIYAPTRVPVP